MAFYTGYFQFLNNNRRHAHQNLRYSFAYGLAVIPAAIGGALDSLIGSGTLFNAQPFRTLFGTPFNWGGQAIGFVAQVLCNTPSYLAHYVLDVPISLAFPAWRTAMSGVTRALFGTEQTRYEKQRGQYGEYRESVTKRYSTAPKQMDSPFGFIAGVIPEAIRFVASEVAALFITTVRFIDMGVSAAIRGTYSLIGRGFSLIGRGIDYVRGVEHSDNTLVESALRQKVNIFKELSLNEPEPGLDVTEQKRQIKEMVGGTYIFSSVKQDPAKVRLANAIIQNDWALDEYLRRFNDKPSQFGAGSSTLFTASANGGKQHAAEVRHTSPGVRRGRDGDS